MSALKIRGILTPACALAQNDGSIWARHRIPGHSEPVTDVTGVRIPEIGALDNDALQIAL